MIADSILFVRLTGTEVKSINGGNKSDNGSSQTYIDIPKGAVSDDQLNAFFGPQDENKAWKRPVKSLTLDVVDNLEISERRSTSNSIRNQLNDRISIWKDNGFPTSASDYDDKENPVIIYLIKTTKGEFYAGWFYLKNFTTEWFLNIELIPVVKDRAGIIKFQNPLEFTTSKFDWPFKGQSDGVEPEDVEKVQEDNNDIFVNALRTKPFLLLAGISGTGKSQKVKELAYASCPSNFKEDDATPGNYCLIEVKPNWHDSTELLGYYSGLEHKYILTKFIRFVWKATKHPEIPFFVCLDEMNLAPVEQYFAEYLSVLETRKRDGLHIVSAPLLTTDNFANCISGSSTSYKETLESPQKDEHYVPYSEEDQIIINDLKENGLSLPENLFVIGTVNMDDTTYQFSRKVIDRAFTIEMNGGNLSDMFKAKDTLQYSERPLPVGLFRSKNVRANDALTDLADEDKANSIITQVPDFLDMVNSVFTDTPFRVSYRVQNELVLYICNLLELHPEQDINSVIADGEFSILIEKILPRVEGDQKLLKEGRDKSVFMSLLDKVSAMTSGELQTKVTEKLKEMDKKLNNQYFTNFFS